MSPRDKWVWVSRLSDVGQLVGWSIAGALAVGGVIARSGYLSGLPTVAIVTYALLAGASFLAIVAFGTWLVRLQPHRAESPQLAASAGSPLELYTVEAARKHEEAAKRLEADKLRLEEEARQTKEQVAALEKEALSSKTTATEVREGFVEMIKLFQTAHRKGDLAHKAIVAVQAALEHREPTVLNSLFGSYETSQAAPLPEKVANAQMIIAQYWTDRLKATEEAEARFQAPAKPE